MDLQLARGVFIHVHEVLLAQFSIVDLPSFARFNALDGKCFGQFDAVGVELRSQRGRDTVCETRGGHIRRQCRRDRCVGQREQLVALDPFQCQCLDLGVAGGVDHQQEFGVGFDAEPAEFLEVGLDREDSPELQLVAAKDRIVRSSGACNGHQDEPASGRSHVTEPDQFEGRVDVQREPVL